VSRLAFSWARPGSDNMPPGSSLRRHILGPQAAMGETDQPAPIADEEGWTHYLARLELAASGRDPGPDPKLKPQSASP